MGRQKLHFGLLNVKVFFFFLLLLFCFYVKKNVGTDREREKRKQLVFKKFSQK